jgi:asparagine synthase (glutamine-hydrolysing)
MYMRNQLLRDSDWASMAHSIELRVPLVDTVLLRSILDLTARGYVATKADVSRATNPEIFALLSNRPKTGFGIPAMQWMQSSVATPRTAGGASRVWAKFLDERFTDAKADSRGP